MVLNTIVLIPLQMHEILLCSIHGINHGPCVGYKVYAFDLKVKQVGNYGVHTIVVVDAWIYKIQDVIS